jgi:hypothetical protein
MGTVARPPTCYLVEWYRTGVDEDQLGDISAGLDLSSTSLTAEGSPVRCVYALAVPADEVVFGIFEADSADAVAQVCRRAGRPPTRLSAAIADRNAGPMLRP